MLVVRDYNSIIDALSSEERRLFSEHLQEWENFYNFDRPHGGLGGQTPYESGPEDRSRGVSGHRPLHTPISRTGCAQRTPRSCPTLVSRF